MIVDLLRNDLARVAEAGVGGGARIVQGRDFSDRPPDGSRVDGAAARGRRCRGRDRDDLPVRVDHRRAEDRGDRGLGELEPEPRGAYTGSMGWIEPGGDAAFNVLIRTLELAREFASREARARIGACRRQHSK